MELVIVIRDIALLSALTITVSKISIENFINEHRIMQFGSFSEVLHNEQV
jgi:hypothetical protein